LKLDVGVLKYNRESVVIILATKKTVKKKPKKKAFRVLCFGAASFLFISFFFGLVVNASIDILNKYKEKEKLNSELLALKEKEQELSLDVEKLKDPEYIARYLREKFYYSKEGEYIIKIPD